MPQHILKAWQEEDAEAIRRLASVEQEVSELNRQLDDLRSKVAHGLCLKCGDCKRTFQEIFLKEGSVVQLNCEHLSCEECAQTRLVCSYRMIKSAMKAGMTASAARIRYAAKCHKCKLDYECQHLTKLYF